MRNRQREFGQVFTNPVIAEYMAELAYFDGAVDVLDPAVGEGIFIQCLEKKNAELQYTAYEIDPSVVERFQNGNSASVTLHQEDYLSAASDKKYDIIICNPPYNRFQNIPERKKYISLLKEQYYIHLSGYSNLCVYFMIKSLNELKENGKCVYITPYEFLNTGYGVVVKEYLLKKRMLKSVIKFDNSLSLFSDAITTSCILVFENKRHDYIEFNTIDSLEQISGHVYGASVKLRYEQIKAEEKWNTYFRDDSIHKYKNLVEFCTVAKVKRGIATGNNSYFTLSRPRIEELGLSSQVCVKCITKSPDVKQMVFTDDAFDELENQGKRVYIFDGEKADIQNDLDYIKWGEENGANQSYLNRHRTPWYQVENKQAAPIWISVFCRDRLKVIRNETEAKNLTTFHGLFTDSDDKAFQDILFCYLLTPICQEILFENKREYGDGLQKFEPNDLNHSQIIDISVITEEDKEKILSLYQKIKSGDDAGKWIAQLNDIFIQYIVLQ